MLRLRFKIRLLLVGMSSLALYTGVRIGLEAHGNGLYFLLCIFPWICVLGWSAIGGPLKNQIKKPIVFKILYRLFTSYSNHPSGVV